MATPIPARQITFGNPDGDGSLSSVPALTFDPAIGDLEMEMNSGAGQFNVLDPEEENGFSASSSDGATYVLGHNQVEISVGTASIKEDISMSVGAGIQIQSFDKDVVLRADTGSVRLQVLATAKLGFYNAAGVTQPIVTGSKASGAALVSLLAALVALGLIKDQTTA